MNSFIGLVHNCLTQAAPKSIAMQLPINIVFLGNSMVKVTCNILKWRTNRAKELFFYILLNNTSGVTTSKLFSVFWEDLDPKKASSQLRTSISYMRKSFSDLGLYECCQFRNGRYFITIENIESDYTRFYTLIDTITHSNLENKILYSKSLCKMYSGEFCSDMDNIEFSLIGNQVYNAFQDTLVSVIYELISFEKIKQALYFINELLKYNCDDTELIMLKNKFNA
jgi:two-component SAPR family response regulator